MASRFARLRKRFGIAAPRVSVRTEVPWYLRWLGIAITIGLAVALASWTYDFGRSVAGFDRETIGDELAATRGELGNVRSELERVQAVANAADSRLSIERAAQKSLSEQIRQLERQNAQLREELAIFEALISSGARATAAVSIQRFKVEADVIPGEYRYHLLLLAGGPRQDRGFQGRLELAVSIAEGGKNAMIVIPDSAGANAGNTEAFRLAFRNYRRVDGTFKLNAKARVDGVQARIFESGSNQATATQTVKPG
jgi:hypothetical protein